MKIFVIIFILNIAIAKKDKIFQIKGDFINKGGKLMFAFNPQKIQKDQLVEEKPHKKIDQQKKFKEQQQELKVLLEARRLKVVEAQINQLIQEKMRASYERDLGIMLRVKTVIKAILQFLFGYPIFIIRKIPELINFFGLPMEVVARERWAFFQRRKIKKIKKRTAVVKKSEIFVQQFNQMLKDQNFQLERANLKATNLLEILNENLINIVTELENQFELDQLNIFVYKLNLRVQICLYICYLIQIQMASNFPFNPLLSITESLKNIQDINFCNTYNSPKNDEGQVLNQMESVNSDFVLSQNSLCNSISQNQSLLRIKSKQIDSQNLSNEENFNMKQISFRKNDKKTRDIFKTPERFRMSQDQKSIEENKKSMQQIRSHIMKTKSQIDQITQNINHQISQSFKDNTVSNLTQKFEYIQDDVQRKSVSIMLQQKSENESESKFNVLIPQNIPVSPLKMKRKKNLKSYDLKSFYSQRIISNNNSTNLQRDNSQYKILDRVRSDKNFEDQFMHMQEQFETPNKIRQFINNKTLKKSKNSRKENFSQQQSNLEKNLILEIHKCLRDFQIIQDSNDYLADVQVSKNQMIQILKQMKFLRNSFQSNSQNYFKSDLQNSSQKLEKLVDLMWNITKSSFDKICIKNLTLFILAVYGIQLEQKIFDQEKINKIQKSFVAFRKNKIFAESQICNQQRKSRCSSQQLLKNFKRKIFDKALQQQQRGKLMDYDLQNLQHTDFLKLQKELKQIEINQKIKVQEENKMKKCTFKPKTNFKNPNISQKPKKQQKTFEISIKLNGKIEKILIKPNENPQFIIEQIIQKHNLDQQKSQKLKKILLQQIK